MISTIIITYILLIAGYIIVSSRPNNTTFKIVGHLLLLISAIVSLPLMSNLDSINNFLTNGKEAIYGVLFGFLGLYYVAASVYFIKDIFKSFAKFRGIWIVSIGIYVFLFRILFFIFIQPNDSFTVKNISIINYMFILIVMFRIALPRLLSLKHKTKINKAEKYENDRSEFLKKTYSTLACEYGHQLDMSYIHKSYDDLWFTNTEAIDYLRISKNNLLVLNDAINSNIDFNKDDYLVYDFINGDVENLYSEIPKLLSEVSNSLGILNLGLDGENKVKNILMQHKYIKNIPNLVIRDNMNQRIECDNLLITDKGIFIIEVKNYGSKGTFTLKIDSSGRWERLYSNKSYVMESPFGQNSRHIGIIKNILFDRGLSVPVYGIVVIANDTVDIINESSNIVIRPDILMDTINNYKSDAYLDINKMNSLYELFVNMCEPDTKHTFTNYNMYNDNMEDLLHVIKLNNELREKIYSSYVNRYDNN